MLVQRRMHEALLAGEMAHYTIEKRYRQADGTHVLGEVTVSLVRDERGRPVSLQSQIRDISEQRRTAEALDRRARYSEAAAELGRIALVAADMSELAERLAEAVAERLGADTCQITEVDGVELHCLAVHGADIGRSQGERWTMRERSLAGLVFGTDGPLVVEDLANSELDASARLLGSGMRSTMGVSVEGRDGPAGMVAVFSREQRAWSHEESSFLHVVANVMGSAIERSTREEAAVHRALHDPLTGLPNRDAVRRPAGAHARPRAPRRTAAGGADRRPRPVQADQRLARPPCRRRAAVRGRAPARRRGAGHGHGRALRRRRVRRAVRRGGRTRSRRSSSPSGCAAELDEPLQVGGAPVYISASFGVAYAGADSDAEGLLRDADAALYRAKARGRGRCELFDAPMRAQAMARLEIETGLRRRARHRPARAALPAGGRPRRAARRWRSRR